MRTRMLRNSLLGTLLAMALIAVAVPHAMAQQETQSGNPPVANAAESTAAATQSKPVVQYVGQMSLSPEHGTVGTVVTVRGEGLPASAEMDLVWFTVDGAWDVRGAEYHGRTFAKVSRPLGRVTTDAAGNFTATFSAPDDYGFGHDVAVVQDGVARNKALFNLDPDVRIYPTSGPVGTPITIEMRGIGWQSMENSWTLLYDNRYTGWMSSVTTRGRAKAVIPAVGAPGKHLLRVLAGAFTTPYLNTPQSPVSYLPEFNFTFTITPGDPLLPPPAGEQGLKPEPGVAPNRPGSPVLFTDPPSGGVGLPATLHGKDFPSGATVKLAWYRVVGNRVSGQGWQEASTVLATVQVGDDGRIYLPFKVLEDLGGPHRIEARVGETVLAETQFNITPTAFTIEPASGPVGTIAKIHIKGVGWTETANIYHVVYDNAYIGYACGFNSQGDIVVELPVTGTPGWHFIELYPGIYKGKEVKGVDNFRIPQLTYEDHPGERLPAFRFAFLITE